MKYVILGTICDSIDILSKERTISELREEKYLAIFEAGAYGFIMSSTYKYRPCAAEFLINND